MQVGQLEAAPRGAQKRQPMHAVGAVMQGAEQGQQVLHMLAVGQALDIDGLEAQPGHIAADGGGKRVEVPVGLAISALERVALGKTLTTGSVRVEAEALDARTGARLAAMVDERVGAKVTGRFDKWSKWQDARDAFDYWSARMRGTLRDFRERAGEDSRSEPKTGASSVKSDPN